MKKKLPLVVFFTVLLLAVGAFHYQGTKSTVNATNGVSDVSAYQQEDTISTVTEESADDQGKKQGSENDYNSDDEKSDVPADSSSGDKETEPVGDKSPEVEETSDEQTSPQMDSIKVGNEEYVDINDMKKFKDLAGFAQKHGARLYAIEYSDCFAIIKGEEVLLFFSVGTVSAGVEDKTVLKDYFKFRGFSEETGIAGNIDVVAESGANVDVTFNETSGYHIFKKDSTIIVNWL
jgi:hypothetical protein